MITESVHRLILGALVLTDGRRREKAINGGDYWFEVSGKDYTTGKAEPIERTLRTLLQEGAVTVVDGYENRTATFLVTVGGPDSVTLAEGEAALANELGHANTLVWEPPDGWGPPSVFEVFTGSMSYEYVESLEVLTLRRTYQVRLVCHPTVRSVNPVTTAAILTGGSTPGTPTTVVMSDASTTTGWTARLGDLSDAGAELQVAGSRSPRVRFTALTDLTVTPYISLVMYRRDPDIGGSDARATLSTVPTLTIDGHARCELVAAEAVVGATRKVRYWWRAPVTSGTKFEFGTDIPLTGTAPGYTSLRIDQLQRSNVPPVSGTLRQKTQTLEVIGSARTQGSLLVAHPEDALGTVVVYTWPGAESSYTPELRPRRTGGGTAVPNVDLVSGARDMLDTGVQFDVPVADLIEGTHQLHARVKSDTNGNQPISGYIQMMEPANGTVLGPVLNFYRTVNFGVTPSEWRNVVLSQDMLPNLAVPENSTAFLRIVIGSDPGASNIDLDEAWLFNTSVGALTWVECGDGAADLGGPSSRLWVNSPTTTDPRPTLYRGTSEDGSDAFHPIATDLPSWGRHEFTPGLMRVFVVTSDAEDAGCSLSYFPRWHTHAAR